MAIGTFARRSGVSVKRLRSYAASGLLAPAAVDADSGYRYYRPDQLLEAQTIDTLRRAGVSLAEIGHFLRAPSTEQLARWAAQATRRAAQSQDALSCVGRLLHLDEGTRAARIEKGATMTSLKTAGRTERGPARESNQDAYLERERLLVIADGMGGPPGGHVASSMAVAICDAAILGRSIDELCAGVRAANRAIWDRACSEPGLAGMGTTICAAALLGEGQLALVHVGDSRAYLFRSPSLVRLTDDHTVTAELIRNGELTPGDARRHPHHGVLTRALGVAPNVEVEVSSSALTPGDRILLCTDGVTNELSDDQIAGVLGGIEDLAQAASGLVDLAIASGGGDDATAAVAEVFT